MAIGDISAFTRVAASPGTVAASYATVPADEEWTIRFMRAVCLLTGTATNPTISAGFSTACNELCFNEVVPIPTASVNGAKNIVGPDFVTLPPGTVVYLRASASGAVRVTITGTKKQVS